jgi:hypothetical protein
MPLTTQRPLRCASAKALPPARVSSRQTCTCGVRVAVRDTRGCRRRCWAHASVRRRRAARSSRAARGLQRAEPRPLHSLRLLRRPPCAPLRRRCAARDAQGGEKRTRTVAWWRENPAALAQVGGHGGACTQAGAHAKCRFHCVGVGRTTRGACKHSCGSLK